MIRYISDIHADSHDGHSDLDFRYQSDALHSSGSCSRFLSMFGIYRSSEFKFCGLFTSRTTGKFGVLSLLTLIRLEFGGVGCVQGGKDHLHALASVLSSVGKVAFRVSLLSFEEVGWETEWVLLGSARSGFRECFDTCKRVELPSSDEKVWCNSDTVSRSS
jgi:hypothetical protein